MKTEKNTVLTEKKTVLQGELSGSGKTAEELIKESLCSEDWLPEAPQDLKYKIDKQIMEEMQMHRNGKQIKIKKVVLAAVAACLLFGTVCVATAGLDGFSITGVGHTPEYTSFQDLDKARQKIGYPVDAIERFSNGFSFQTMATGECVLEDETGKRMERVLDLSLTYQRQQEKLVLSAHRNFAGESEESMAGGRTPDKSIRCGENVTVNYYATTYQFVPVGYEMTEADLKNMEREDYEFSEGSDKVEIQQEQSVLWVKDGVTYDLHGFGLSLGADELFAMAGEIIEGSAE